MPIFPGTILTLRYFWQSDYESWCSHVVGATQWTKSPTAVRTWLAVMLQDEEWTAYINLVSGLLMDPLSASWRCQDSASRANTWAAANRERALLSYTGRVCGGCRFTGMFSRVNGGNTQNRLLSLEYWPERWPLPWDRKRYLNRALILFPKNSLIIHSWARSAATRFLKTTGQILSNGDAEMSKIQRPRQGYTRERELCLQITYLR